MYMSLKILRRIKTVSLSRGKLWSNTRNKIVVAANALIDIAGAINFSSRR